MYQHSYAYTFVLRPLDSSAKKSKMERWYMGLFELYTCPNYVELENAYSPNISEISNFAATM